MSGKSAKDNLQDALTEYEEQMKAPFTMVTLWSLLSETPKWQEQLAVWNGAAATPKTERLRQL